MPASAPTPPRPALSAFPAGDPLLSQVVEELQALNQRKEESFLALGASLEAVAARSGESSLLAQRATRVLSSRESGVAAEGLMDMARRIGERMAGWEKESAGQAEVLREVLGLLGRVGEELGALRSVSRELNILGTATRVQSSRLRQGGAAFLVLAGEIGGISQGVGETTKRLAQGSHRIRSGVEGVLGRIRGDLARNRGRGEELLGLSRGVLKTLETLGASSGSTTVSIGERSRQVSGALEELVVAVQYEDITRQELEKLAGEMAADPGLSAKGVWAGRLSSVAREIRLQQERIRAQFQLLEGSVSGLWEETSRGHQAGSTFLGELEKGMAAVAGLLSETLEMGRTTAEGLSRAAEAVGEMTAHLDPVAELGEDIGLLALNARVKAAHLGEEGAGLRIIAQAISEVSRRAQELSLILGGDLRQVGEAAARMSGDIRNAMRDDEANLGTMVRELGAILDALRSLQKMVLDQLARIQDLSRSLVGELRETLARFEGGEQSARDLEGMALRLGGADESESSALTPVHAGTVELF